MGRSPSRNRIWCILALKYESVGNSFHHFPANQLTVDSAFLCKPTWGYAIVSPSPLSWYHPPRPHHCQQPQSGATGVNIHPPRLPQRSARWLPAQRLHSTAWAALQHVVCCMHREWQMWCLANNKLNRKFPQLTLCALSVDGHSCKIA